jgi:hypothetical protein
LRQLCNVAFAASLENLDGSAAEEFLYELRLPLDPMKQADYIMGRNS